MEGKKDGCLSGIFLGGKRGLTEGGNLRRKMKNKKEKKGGGDAENYDNKVDEEEEEKQEEQSATCPVSFSLFSSHFPIYLDLHVLPPLVQCRPIDCYHPTTELSLLLLLLLLWHTPPHMLGCLAGICMGSRFWLRQASRTEIESILII